MSEETNVQAADEKQPEETVTDEVEETTEPTEEVPEGQPEEAKETETEPEPAKEPPVEREVYTMSVSKAQKEKKNALEKLEQELTEKHAEEIAALKAQPPKTDDELDTFAEEQGIDPAVMKKIVDVVQKPLSEKLTKVDAIVEEQEKEANIAKTSQEFDDKVSKLIQTDYPTATPEHIAKIRKEVVDLAFSAEYHTYKLEDIYKVNKSQFEYKDNYTAEPSDGNTVDIIDFDNLSDEAEHKLAQENPEKFAEYIQHQEAKQSVYTVE